MLLIIEILFSSKPSFDKLFTLSGDLQFALHNDDIDLVVLNDANPYLRFEVVSGKSLFCRDPNRRAEFVSLMVREYNDESAMRKKPNENIVV